MIESSPVKWILASNSPRRRELLGLLGLDFVVMPADVDESTLEGETPQDYVLRLAERKARAVAIGFDSATWVIAADTTVVDDGEILGKPLDQAEAEQMLHRLRGRAHQVFTALAVYNAEGRTLQTDLGESQVPMRNYTDEEAQAYIASGDPFDKAGGYAIQHAGFHPVEDIQSCYANVVGFPLCHLGRTLRKMGQPLAANVPAVCQTALGYHCPVYDMILRETL